LHGTADFAWRDLLEATLHIDPTLLSSGSALLGAIVGGGASLVAAIYTQRGQDRLQRVAREVEKREAVYADFVMHASNLLLNAYTHDGIVLGGDEQPDRAYQPHEAVCSASYRRRSGKGAQGHCRNFAETEYRTPTTREEALSKSLDPDPLLEFSSACRADLDNVRRTTV
jgi:hypothetical protein